MYTLLIFNPSLSSVLMHLIFNEVLMDQARGHRRGASLGHTRRNFRDGWLRTRGRRWGASLDPSHRNLGKSLLVHRLRSVSSVPFLPIAAFQNIYAICNMYIKIRTLCNVSYTTSSTYAIPHFSGPDRSPVPPSQYLARGGLK